MTVGSIHLSQLRVDLERKGCEPGIRFQSNGAVAVQMVSGAERITAGKDIACQILQQIHGPDRRLLLPFPLEAEGQLKAKSAHLRVLTLLLVQLGKAVGHIVPVGDSLFALPDLHPVQRVIPAQEVGDHRSIEPSLLTGIERMELLGNRVKSALFQCGFVLFLCDLIVHLAVPPSV